MLPFSQMQHVHPFVNIPMMLNVHVILQVHVVSL